MLVFLNGRFHSLNPSLSDPGRRKKINLKFYFHTSFWCLKRDTTKKCENKNLIFIFIQLSLMDGTGKVKVWAVSLQLDKKLTGLSPPPPFLLFCMLRSSFLLIYKGTKQEKCIFICGGDLRDFYPVSYFSVKIT